MNSWISTGQNLPISPDQLMQVFGQGQMQQMAASSGMDLGQLSGGLADLLPQLIDQLTPSGQVPAGGRRRRAGRTVEDDAARLRVSCRGRGTESSRSAKSSTTSRNTSSSAVTLLGIEVAGARQPVEHDDIATVPAAARADR